MFEFFDKMAERFDSWLYGPYYQDVIREMNRPKPKYETTVTTEVLKVAVITDTGDLVLTFGEGLEGTIKAADRDVFLNQIYRAVQASRSVKP